jgi:hypothetical protein
MSEEDAISHGGGFLSAHRERGVAPQFRVPVAEFRQMSDSEVETIAAAVGYFPSCRKVST